MSVGYVMSRALFVYDTVNLMLFFKINISYILLLLLLLYERYYHRGESNGKLPLRTCPECSVPEPTSRLTGLWFLPKPAQGLNTNYYYLKFITWRHVSTR
jgi:hypothetical protein